MSADEIPDVRHFQLRVARDAWLDAEAIYWRRRAAAFRDARPRDGDFHGRSTQAERSARYRRLTAIADACENRARVAQIGGTYGCA